MPELPASHYLLAIFGAFCIGVAKSGFSGIAMLHVLIFAFLFGARSSTGIVLPMLIIGDVLAVFTFRQHARWEYIRRMLPPAVTGVVIGWLLMLRIPDATYAPLLGWTVLGLTVLQLLRYARPELFAQIPHTTGFTWTLALLAGTSTMLLNGAGPVMALYFLAVGLPKFEMVGTSAFFFLILNVIKLPFSASLNLIHPGTLLLNALLIPAIFAGLCAGRWLVHHTPQKLFDTLLLLFAVVAAARLVGLF